MKGCNKNGLKILRTVINRVLSLVIVMSLCLVFTPLTVALADEDDGDGGENYSSLMQVILTLDEDPFASGTGTEEDPYIISTAKGFVLFGNEVEKGTTYLGQYIKLGADIDLGEYCGENRGNWKPIGIYNGQDFEPKAFNGTFDGDGHTISGLFINKGGYGAGLFSKIEKDSIICNLTVKGTVRSKSSDVGGIVGHAAGPIRDCNFYGDVKGETNTGGIVGYGESKVDRCCYYGGTVTGKVKNTGGIVGYSNSDSMVRDCCFSGTVCGYEMVGGIAGRVRGPIENCVMKKGGSVTGLSRFVGGIAGRADGDASGCVANGSVDGKKDSVAGIFGVAYKNKVSNCTNRCVNVIGYSYVGGIAGTNNAHLITNCNSYGDISSSSGDTGGVAGGSGGPIIRCNNEGTVNSTGKRVGGIVGNTFDCKGEKGTVEQCINYGDITGQSPLGGVVGEAYHKVTDCYNNGKLSCSNGTAGDIIGSSGGIKDLIVYTEKEPELYRFNLLDDSNNDFYIPDGAGETASTFGEGNWVMILVLACIAVIVITGGVLFVRSRKKGVTAVPDKEE